MMSHKESSNNNEYIDDIQYECNTPVMEKKNKPASQEKENNPRNKFYFYLKRYKEDDLEELKNWLLMLVKINNKDKSGDYTYTVYMKNNNWYIIGWVKTPSQQRPNSLLKKFPSLLYDYDNFSYSCEPYLASEAMIKYQTINFKVKFNPDSLGLTYKNLYHWQKELNNMIADFEADDRKIIWIYGDGIKLILYVYCFNILFCR